ncbi:MAG: RND family transporter, partial [Lachnospiraceae bacterium]
MRKFYSKVVNNPVKILVFFFALAVAGAILQSLVGVNYDMKEYLPEDSNSTVSLDLMNEEFEGGIPNARVMVKDLTLPEALEYKEKLEECEGVTDVMWLDDAINIYQPLEIADSEVVETYYKDNTALYTVTIDEDKRIEAVDAIRGVIGDENAMTGDAVSTALATTSTVNEIRIITILAICIVLLVLIFTTTSWMEPLIVLLGLGVAIMINLGTNLIFGEISFVTNAAGPVLQLAVSLDYSIFLLHRYEECLLECPDRKNAMVDALCKSTSSILSSGLTTVIGFLALLFMRFGIGPDLGMALAKGVVVSLIVVFIFMPALILKTYPLIQRTHHRRFLPEFKTLGKVVFRIMVPLVCIFAVMMVPSELASNQNSYYYGSSHIFGETTQLGKDSQAIEDVFGKSDNYVVLVPNGNPTAERQLSDALKEIPEVTSIISYADTVGAEIPKEYLDEDTLSQLVSDNYSRMVLAVDTDYEGEETFDLVERIRETVDEYYPGNGYLAGDGVSSYDLMDTITADTAKVNAIAIGAVFVVLMLSMKSLILPVILVLSIETAIWINMAIPYFWDATIFYIAYLIISSIQLGATVDYAILLTSRYLELRRTMKKKEAVLTVVPTVTTSLLTSGTVLAAVGFLLNKFSSHGILSQLGLFLGRGTLLSLVIVFFVLPGLLYLCDGLIKKTTMKSDF